MGNPGPGLGQAQKCDRVKLVILPKAKTYHILLRTVIGSRECKNKSLACSPKNKISNDELIHLHS